MLGEPKQFVPGRRRVDGLASDTMYISRAIFIYFFRRTHIQPKNGRTNWLVLTVEAYEGLSLMGYGYSGDQFGRKRFCGCFCYRGCDGAPPVAGVLLTPARFWLVHIEPLAPFSNGLASFIPDHGLCRGGRAINTDYKFACHACLPNLCRRWVFPYQQH